MPETEVIYRVHFNDGFFTLRVKAKAPLFTPDVEVEEEDGIVILERMSK